MAVQAPSGIAAIAGADAVVHRDGDGVPGARARTAPVTEALEQAESIRTMIIPVQPQSRAAPIACAARLAAPRRGGRVPAAQPRGGDHRRRERRADDSASGSGPGTSTDFPWIWVWPNFAPCLACP